MCPYTGSSLLGREVPLAEVEPRPDSFFLVETSGRAELTPREMCAVESAAAHHPHRHVYVLLTSPTVRLSGAAAAVAAKRRNVNFKHVPFESFVAGTPLERVWADGRVAASSFLVSHASDLLRFLVLHRYGGTYLDLDQVVVRTFPDDVPNFIGQENSKYVGKYYYST